MSTIIFSVQMDILVEQEMAIKYIFDSDFSNCSFQLHAVHDAVQNVRRVVLRRSGLYATTLATTTPWSSLSTPTCRYATSWE